MNLTDSIYSAPALLVTALMIFVISPGEPTHFERLIDKFERGSVFKAGFTHQYIDSYTGDTVSTKGNIWVSEKKYKVSNNNQTVIVDGDYSRVYDKTRNRVIISTYEPEEDDFAPSRFLNGSDSTYVVDKQAKEGGVIKIQLSSSDPFAVFSLVEITISDQLVPLKIHAVDQVDNKITTVFSRGEFIDRKEGMFELSYPENAEIIDMRN